MSEGPHTFHSLASHVERLHGMSKEGALHT